jgi:hypothetical protein
MNRHRTHKMTKHAQNKKSCSYWSLGGAAAFLVRRWLVAGAAPQEDDMHSSL